MTVTSPAEVHSAPSTDPTPSPPAITGRYDRSIVEGPLRSAVWKIAWPSMLTNIIGGIQGIVDQVLVGHIVGYTGNAAIGVASQIFIVVIVFLMSLFTGMSVLVARFAGAGEERRSTASCIRRSSRHSGSRSSSWRPSVTSRRRFCSTSSTPHRR